MGGSGKEKTTEQLLQEDQGAEREGKFLVMGARRDGGTMQPVMFKATQGAADAAAEALTSTGWATAEVYTRVSAFTRA